MDTNKISQFSLYSWRGWSLFWRTRCESNWRIVRKRFRIIINSHVLLWELHQKNKQYFFSKHCMIRNRRYACLSPKLKLWGFHWKSFDHSTIQYRLTIFTLSWPFIVEVFGGSVVIYIGKKPVWKCKWGYISSLRRGGDDNCGFG